MSDTTVPRSILDDSTAIESIFEAITLLLNGVDPEHK